MSILTCANFVCSKVWIYLHGTIKLNVSNLTSTDYVCAKLWIYLHEDT